MLKTNPGDVMKLNQSSFLPRLSRPTQMLMATLLVAVAAGLTPTAHAQPMGGMHGGPAGMRGGGDGMHGDGMGMGGGMAGAHMGRALDAVKATPEQRAQIKTIMEAARTDLKTQREAGRTLHQQMQAAFTQPTVDARAVEALRVQIAAQHDTASKRMTLAMLDASKVLSVEQRKTLADLMAQRQAMMQRHASERATLDKSTK
jgi:Spy/CpxP family protein refolding chaperone